MKNSKMKTEKKFLRNSMTSEGVSNITLLSVERIRAEKIDLQQMTSLLNLTIDMIVIKGLNYIELMLI